MAFFMGGDNFFLEWLAFTDYTGFITEEFCNDIMAKRL